MMVIDWACWFWHRVVSKGDQVSVVRVGLMSPQSSHVDHMYVALILQPYIHPSISILNQVAIRVPFNEVGSTRLCRTTTLQESLSSGLTLAMPHPSITVFIHSTHVLRGLPFSLVPAGGKLMIDLLQCIKYGHTIWATSATYQLKALLEYR